MDLALSPDNQQFIEQAVRTGAYTNETALLDVAVAKLREQEETLAAIHEGLSSIDRGEGIPIEEADALFRKKHGIKSTR